MPQDARYDAVAGWYEAEFVQSELYAANREIVLRVLGDGPGRLLDVGCGGAVHAPAYEEAGWRVTGVDESEEQLRFARGRGVDVVRADAAALPFEDASFDAAVSTWLHTDVDDFAAVVREVARVLRAGAPFVYAGAHPCFVGPHSRFIGAEGIPELHPGYFRTAYYAEGPGINPTGLRAKVGAMHLPLGLFLQAFLDAGLRLEHFEEPERGDYPYMVALRWRR
jgi:SAM-dependent methyltransferase